MKMRSPAEILRELRSHTGLTQKELAQLAGVGQSTISDAEKGIKVPSIDTYIALVTAMGMSVDITPRPLSDGDPYNISELCYLLGLLSPANRKRIARLARVIDQLPGEMVDGMIGLAEAQRVRRTG